MKPRGLRQRLSCGYDTTRHMNPAYARRLLELVRAGRDTDTDVAFVQPGSVGDDFAEELAEAAVTGMTSGENALVDEERGGPFTETSGRVELASGSDDSNVAHATREP